MKYFKYWTDVESRKLWSSQLWKQFMQLRIEKPAKSQDFNPVWTCDPATTVRCSNQISYEATDVGSWSFVGRREPVRNECEVIIWNISYVELRMWNQESYEPRRDNSNLCSCIYRRLKKVRTSTGFEPRNSRYRCDGRTNWAMKPLTLGAGHLWVLRRPKGMNLKFMWNISNIELWMWNQVSYYPRSCENNLWICIYRSLQKVRTSTGFEPISSWYRCDGPTNRAMKPLTLGAGHVWVLKSPRGMNLKLLWNISNIELRMWNRGRYDPPSYESNLCNCVYRSLQEVRTLTGFELMTSWYPCNARTNWAIKPLTLGAGDLWVLRSPWGINLKLQYEIFHILN